MFAAGTIIGGKYKVERTLGAGGMGTVVAAAHLQLGHRVAIKVLHEDLAKEQHIVDRFVREARACVQLDSPHVCRVNDIDVLPDGRPYIIMEWLSGKDLAEAAKQGPMTLRKICEYVAQACDGIADAHALGIIHRDLKPSNLFLQTRDDGTELLKILDFGIARVPTTNPDEMTQTGVVMGSPSYMSPEQLRSAKIANPQTDIWSLGVILYELIAGRRPYVGDTFMEITLRIAEDPLPPISEKVPRDLVNVIARCLNKDPRERFRDATALANELRRIGPTIPLPLTQAITIELPAASGTAAPGPGTAAALGFGSTTPASPAPIPVAPKGPPRVEHTTLGGAAGASLIEATPSGRRGVRVAVIAASAVGVGVILALVFGRPGKSSQHDDAAAVAAPGGSAQAVAASPDAGLASVVTPPMDAASLVEAMSPDAAVVAAPVRADAGVRVIRHATTHHKQGGSAQPVNVEDLRH